ncbi:hypothetical protein P0Y35_01135 [Kiritimatiellaeota bacterium B1221]|nr:hypothetical protein [Kiritimatiellaeota bacterium B1221]
MIRKLQTNAYTVFLCWLFVSGSFRFEAQQIWAWGNMLADFGTTKSFTAAFNETFSGESPCELCTKLTKEQTHESPDRPQATSLEAPEASNWLLLLTKISLPVPADGMQNYKTGPFSFLSTLREAPQPPPPQQVS